MEPSADLLLLPAHDPAFELIYCCRKCRGPLFRPSNLVEHAVGRHSFSYRRTAKDIAAHDGDAARAGHAPRAWGGEAEGGEEEGPSSSSSSRACTSFFLEEALQWMKAAAEDVEGKLTCPHGSCGARLGMLRWAGGQCSCGTWVCPALQLNKSAIDERHFPLAAGARQ
jgi:hypothetical protein